jgi:HemY protein
MIRFILFLAVAACVAVGAVWFAEHPGLVVLEWQGRRVETSVGIFLLALLVVAVLAALLFELLRLIWSAPRRWRSGRRRARELRGYRELARGLVSAAAGDVRATRLHTRQAERLIADEPAVRLLTAQTAQLEGDDERALLTYRAMLREPETEFLGLRSLLGQSIRIGDREEALELARRAYRENPETSWTATTLFDLLTKQALWAEALEVVNALQQVGVVTPTAARRHRAALEYLVGRDKRAEGKLDGAVAAARRSVRLMPTFTPAPVLLARCYLEQEREIKAERTLERAWAIRPHPDLAQAYADLRPDESAAERYLRFDRLRRRHPSHAETAMALAAAALGAGRPEAAREHLEPALQEGATARACRLKAEIEKAAGAAPEEVESWLGRALDAKPDLAWVCEDTGDVLPAWQPFGTSGRFDVVVWSTPPAVTTLVAHDHIDTVTLGQVTARPDGAAAPESPAAAAETTPPDGVLPGGAPQATEPRASVPS